MSDIKSEMKERDKEVAHNEEQRHAVSAVRISSWAVFAAVIVCGVIVAFIFIAVRR